jgi:hypothetical protein
MHARDFLAPIHRSSLGNTEVDTLVFESLQQVLRNPMLVLVGDVHFLAKHNTTWTTVYTTTNGPGSINDLAAFDENPTTRWSSAFSDPQWIQVDLGATYNISEVVLYWETAYGKSYQIQVSSDATNWNTIYSTTNGPGGTEYLTGLSGTGRYVRMYGTVRGTQWGYSLWEFQIFPALSPELSIALSGTNVVLSWPVVSGNTWSLQTAPTLGLPVSWSNLTTAPFLLNSEYLLTNEVSAPAQFYRLEQGP